MKEIKAMSWGELSRVGGTDITEDIPLTIPLIENEVILGRIEGEKVIVCNKPYISGKHFQINKITKNETEIDYEIIDYSSNGTYLNNELIGKGKTLKLKSNDNITIKFRGVDKINFQFILLNNNNNTNNNGSNNLIENIEPPIKYQRSSLNKRTASAIAFVSSSPSPSSSSGTDSNLLGTNMIPIDEDSAKTKRINSLERENQQQQVRITNYITKLESSAREIGNLQATHQATREVLQEKENQLIEMKQTRYFNN